MCLTQGSVVCATFWRCPVAFFGCCSLLRNAVAVMALLFSAPRRFESTVQSLSAYAVVYAWSCIMPACYHTGRMYVIEIYLAITFKCGVEDLDVSAGCLGGNSRS